MTYEIVPNALPDTRGKYHLRCVSEKFDAVDSEHLANRNRQVFDSLATATARCSSLNHYLEMLTMAVSQ